MRPGVVVLIASLAALGACGERSEEAGAPGDARPVPQRTTEAPASRQATPEPADTPPATEVAPEDAADGAEASSASAPRTDVAPRQTAAAPAASSAPGASAPVAAPSAATLSANGSGTVLKADKLYSEPSATARVTALVARGAKVDILAKAGGWLRVKAGSDIGWMRLLSVRAGTGGLGGAALGDVVGAATTRSDPTRVVAVAGLRGLNDEDLKQAQFNTEELARLEALNPSATQVRSFASQAGLAAASVPNLPKPQAK